MKNLKSELQFCYNSKVLRSLIYSEIEKGGIDINFGDDLLNLLYYFENTHNQKLNKQFELWRNQNIQTM